MASSYWDNLSEREKDWSMFSDYHKSVYGCRPREHEFLNASDERRAEIWKETAKDAKRVEAEEAEAEKRCIANFEAEIVQNFERGALDREQAIDWLLQSRDMDRDGLYDGGYNCYLLGLPKSYANELR
jgi:hypothetical protein